MINYLLFIASKIFANEKISGLKFLKKFEKNFKVKKIFKKA